MLDFVDDVSACRERFGPMPCAHTHPDRHIADGQVADAMYAGSVLEAKSLYRLRNDALAFLDREGLERLVLEVSYGKPIVVVTNPTFKRRIAASCGIKQPRAQPGLVDFLATETEIVHVELPS